VIFAADIIAGPMVALGTHMLSPLRALVQSMLIFTVLVVAAMPSIEALAGSFKMKLQTMHWMVIYFFVNAACLWAVTRFAEMLGLGVASWQIIAILAIVLDVAQGFAAKYVMRNA
jgi:hypothetical protein